MGIHFRRTPTIAMIGALALGGVSIGWAQDTSAAARQDTSGYQTYNKSDTSKANASTDTALRAKPGVQTGPSAKDSGAAMHRDTSGYQQSSGSSDTSQMGRSSSDTSQMGRSSSNSHFKAHGVVTDTALRAKRGVQTGPSAADSTGHHRRHHMRMSAMDTVVCKDGSNASNKGTSVCGSHGGVDTAATWAAMRARGYQGRRGTSSDSSSSKQSPSSNSSSSNNSSSNSSSGNSSSGNSASNNSASNNSSSNNSSSDTSSTHSSP